MNIRWLYPYRALAASLVAATIAVVLMTVLVIRQEESQSNDQVYLEAGGSVGPNPFVRPSPPTAAVGENPENSGSPGASALFQATISMNGQSECDVDKLISHLTADPRAGEAWVRALNFDRTLSWSVGSRIEVQQLPAYVHELRPRVLTEDLRVTNYQFVDDAALLVQSVLQKGTAILVDAKDIARVRCASGNPLTPMIPSKTPPAYHGTPWPSFRAQQVVVTQHAPQCGRDESYDGKGCRRIVVCPHSEGRSDDSWCDGPGQPSSSDTARRPSAPWWLDRPEPPDAPPPPGEPGRPEKPPYPNKPESPEKQPQPNKPESPEKQPQPVRADESPHTQKPTQPEKEKRRQPEKADQPAELPRQDRPMQPQRGEHLDKPKPVRQPPRPDNPDNGEHPGKAKRADHPEKPSKSEKALRSEKSEKSEHGQHEEALKRNHG
jgi:hypothetical protein